MFDFTLSEVPWLGPVYAVSVGLVLGSFVNVLIHRLPRGESVVVPPSACPSCGGKIRPYDNIPLLSYVLLRGRCRHCGRAIALRYPFVEALVGAGSLFAFLRHGLSLEYACELGLVAALVALVFIDYDHHLLPNVITIPGTVAGLLLSWPRATITLAESLLGAILGAGLLYLVAGVYFRLRKIEGLGMGDVKMMAMLGAFFGWKGVFLILLIGSFLGAVVGLVLMAARGKGLKTALPFGTFLGIAAVATLFFGSSFIEWYSRFLYL